MRRAAFTLVELLVVMAIIALLVAISMGAIGSVRQAARDTTCMNNLRQVSLGVRAFAIEHTGHAPGSGFLTPYGTSWGAPPDWPRWIGTQSVPIKPQQDVVFSESYAGQSSSTTEPAQCMLISMGYLDTKKIYQCPSIPETRPLIPSSPNLNQFFPYGLNLLFSGNRYNDEFCGEETPTGNPAEQSFRKCPPLETANGRSTETVLMLDLCTIYDFAWRYGSSVDGNEHQAAIYAGIAPHKYGRRVNAIYCDGRVAATEVKPTIISGVRRLCVPSD